MNLIMLFKRKWSPRPKLPPDMESVSVLDSIINDRNWYKPKNMKEERHGNPNQKRPAGNDPV